MEEIIKYNPFCIITTLFFGEGAANTRARQRGLMIQRIDTFLSAQPSPYETRVSTLHN